MIDREDGATSESVHQALEKMVLGSSEENENPITTITHNCTTCDKPARLCCVGCDTTPLPADDAREKTWYCGKECQVKDWTNHKKHCKEIKAKVYSQSLRRASQILQGLFKVYRHVAYDLSIASAERKGNTLHIKEGEYDLVNNLLPGYDHVESIMNLEPEDHAMMLAIMSCSDSFIHIHECCALFLEDTGIARTIKEVRIIPKPGPRRWEMRRYYGIESSENFPHAVHQITLKDGTRWALDLSAAQYGHTKSFLRWERYTEERVVRVTGSEHFGQAINAWNSHAARNTRAEGLDLDINDTASIGKAISWSVSQIANDMLLSVQHSLKTLGMSARELLLVSSEAQFEITSSIIVDSARKTMQGFKLKMTPMTDRDNLNSAFSTSGPADVEDSKPWTTRVDRNGNTHFIL